MQEEIIYNKQSLGTWIGVESGLKFTKESQHYVTIPYSPQLSYLNSTKDFTISTICIPISYGTGKYIPITKTSDSTVGYVLEISGSIVSSYFINGPTIYKGYTANLVSTLTNKLIHITITHVASTQTHTIYINGVAVSSTTFSQGTYVPADNTNPVRLNRVVTNTQTWIQTAQQSNLIIYNKALTASEVNQCYSEIGIVPKSLHPYVVGHWTCNQRYGKVLFDSVEQYNYTKYTMLLKDVTSTPPAGVTVDPVANTITFAAVAQYTSFLTQATPSILVVGDTYTFSFDVNITQGALGLWILGQQQSEIGIGVRTVSITIVYRTTDVHGSLYTNPVYLEPHGTTTSAVVSNFKFVKGTGVLTANHGELINYTDAEAGIVDKGSQTAFPDHYTKKIETRFSRKFTDDTDRITTDSTAVDYTPLVNNSFTVEFYAKKPNAIGSNGLAVTFGKQYTDNACAHIKFGNNTLFFNFWNNDHSVSYTYDNRWIHFAFVYDHINLRKKIYANGVVILDVATTAFALQRDTNNPFTVGGWGVNEAEYFGGYINNLRVWSVVRTSQQIATNMNKLIGAATTGLFLEWSNGETINGTIKDYAGTRVGTRAGNSTDVVEFKSSTPEPTDSLKSEYKGGSANHDVVTTVTSANAAYNLFQDAYTFRLAIYLHKVPDANRIAYRFPGSQELLIMITPTAIEYRAGTSVTAGTIPHNGVGFYFITITRDYIKSKVIMRVNHQNSLITNNTYGQLNSFTISGITHSYGNAAFTPDCYYIQAYGYRKESSISDHLNWMNNTLIKTPRNTNMVFFRDYNKIVAGKVLDISGNGNDGTLVNYSTAEATPTDPAYAVIPTYDIKLKDAPSTDLILDLDAREGITLTAGKISQWKSKVGSYVAYENDVNRQPTWERSTGIPGVAFGASNSLVIDNFDLSTTGQIGILVFGKFNNIVGTSIVLEHGLNVENTINNWLLAMDTSAGTGNVQSFFYTEKNSSAMPLYYTSSISANPVVMGAKMIRGVGERATDFGTSRTLGTTIATSPSTYGTFPLNIGNRSGSTTLGMDGIINRILIYKSHAAYEQARRYLGLKHKSNI